MTPTSPPRRIPRRRVVLLFYIVLLALSQAVRWVDSRRMPEPDGFEVASLLAVEKGQRTDALVGVAYRGFGDPSLPTVLLVHGSPISSFDLAPLAEKLAAAGCRVILPDLPGFGKSTQRVPDYSIVAQAAYLLQLADTLAIPRFHLVAYSMGGGAALHIADEQPERVASLTLLSSIGVQELELMGNYELNHGLHGLQLGGLWMLANFVPHFGWLDGMMLNLPYARNFYESDQRPLRGFMERYAGPALVVQGRNDILVPPAAAAEHHRIMPQSELVWLDTGHIAALKGEAPVAAAISGFIGKVERGEGITRATASAERIKEATLPFDRSRVMKATGIALFVLMLIIAFSTLISEDLACIGAGLLAAQGLMSFPAAAVASFAGIFFGDLGLFLAGKHIGGPALRKRPLRWFISEDAIQESATWFSERGPIVIILSRFVPGSRLPTYFAAGMLHTKLWNFLFYFLIAGVVWAPLLVWLAMTLGGKLLAFMHAYKTLTVVSVVVVALLLWIFFELVIPLFSFRGRRLLVSSWRRKRRWEYWPSWVFYPPVALYCAWLAIKHRGVGVFAAANPAMPAGGLLGESKLDILRGLEGAGEVIAQFDAIEANAQPEEALAAVQRFMASRRLSYPVVLKPDVGQRGLGVLIAHNDQDVRNYFARPRPRIVVQEFAPGLEFGMFYYRYPTQAKGHIFAITEKRLPVVIGDGKSTLERLILLDDRAVCMAHFYLKQLRERLFEVPADGEKVQLVDLGTHCRGAAFYDGAWLKTPELEAEMDRISQCYKGFYFGRYDIRTTSVEDFKKGRNYKVLELNGVSSEATSIYDPVHTVFTAWRTLMRQWRIAFEIGAENRARGVAVPSALDVLKLIGDYQPSPEAR